MKKYNLLIPIAGVAKRFADCGYNLPKPLIQVGDKLLIEVSLSSIKISECQIVFIVKGDHCRNYSLDEILYQKFGKDIKIKILEEETDGALCTCLEGINLCDDRLPLLIYTPDVIFYPKFDPGSIGKDLDGQILTFKANSPDHSYALTDGDQVIKTAEKTVISSDAAVGLYYFKNIQTFKSCAAEAISNKEKVVNEYYICPIYNKLINKKLKVGIKQVSKMYVLGTPSELNFYIKNVYPNKQSKVIGLSSDHSGFELKKIAREILTKEKVKFIDYGCFTDKDSDYNDFLKQAMDGLRNKHINYVFSFCRTGQGMNIMSNKYEFGRSGLILNEAMAELSVTHNCCNCFSFPSAFITSNELEKCICKILTSTFDGGRHYNRIKHNGNKS